MQHSVSHSVPFQRGGTMVGFIVGLVVGLAIALAVAVAITKGPMPFVNKVAKGGLTPTADDGTAAKLPDPNKSLYPKDAPAITAPSAPAATAASTATPAGAPVATAPTAPTASASPLLTAPSTAASSAAPDAKTNYLQTGAFKTTADAENMKAKLALLGFEAQSSPTSVNNETLYRVRLGPYFRIDDLNRVRQRLVENGIDATLVPGG
jgi:cell division protein FtsN